MSIYSLSRFLTPFFSAMQNFSNAVKSKIFKNIGDMKSTIDIFLYLYPSQECR